MLTADTRITVTHDGEATSMTWQEFADANSEMPELYDVGRSLRIYGTATVGGGASPLATIQVMLTAETITDEQIRELRSKYLYVDNKPFPDSYAVEVTDTALGLRSRYQADAQTPAPDSIHSARARCAEILNARREAARNRRITSAGAPMFHLATADVSRSSCGEHEPGGEAEANRTFLFSLVGCERCLRDAINRGLLAQRRLDEINAERLVSLKRDVDRLTAFANAQLAKGA